MSVDGEIVDEHDPDADDDWYEPEDKVGKVSLPDMLGRLHALTGSDFSAFEQSYETFVVNANLAVTNTPFLDRVSDLHESLMSQRVVGKIRGVEAWADGTESFRVVRKSWNSFVDKLYRINQEENGHRGEEPFVLSIRERAERVKDAGNRLWITPVNAYNYVDDIIRTKFVVPFADGVVDVSETVRSAATDLGLRCYRRYHAKDSGYHAHHVYVLLPVPGPDGDQVEIAFEVKVLTKLQDTLGELTHLLYEYKRTGRIPAEKKRKLAWIFDSPDFTASYVGHTAHYIEASLVRLKTELSELEGAGSGES